MSPLVKNLLVALVIGVIAWYAWTTFNTEDNPALTVESGAQAVSVKRDIQEFLRQTQELRAMDFESGIFDDPRFDSLVDHTIEIIDEPTGRENPFTPF